MPCNSGKTELFSFVLEFRENRSCRRSALKGRRARDANRLRLCTRRTSKYRKISKPLDMNYDVKRRMFNACCQISRRENFQNNDTAFRRIFSCAIVAVTFEWRKGIHLNDATYFWVVILQKVLCVTVHKTPFSPSNIDNECFTW